MHTSVLVCVRANVWMERAHDSQRKSGVNRMGMVVSGTLQSGVFRLARAIPAMKPDLVFVPRLSRHVSGVQFRMVLNMC